MTSMKCTFEGKSLETLDEESHMLNEKVLPVKCSRNHIGDETMRKNLVDTNFVLGYHYKKKKFEIY